MSNKHSTNPCRAWDARASVRCHWWYWASSRYSLVILFVCAALVMSVACIGIAGEKDGVLYRQRGSTKYRALTPQTWRPDDIIHFDLTKGPGVAQFIERRSKDCPNVRSVILGGEGFDIRFVELAHHFPKLQLIVLDSVRPSQAAECRAKWPKTTFWESQRTALARLHNSTAVVTIEGRALPVEFPEIESTHGLYVLELDRHLLMQYESPPLDETALRAIPYLGTLKVLDLSETDVDDAALAKLLSKCRLERLCLRETKIDGSGLKHLHPEGLRNLDLSETAFRGKWLSSFTNLEVLNLTFSSFSDEDIDSLADMQSLQWLHIEGTKVTSDGIGRLGMLKTLEVISVNEEFKNSEGVRKLQSENEGLEIAFHSVPQALD